MIRCTKINKKFKVSLNKFNLDLNRREIIQHFSEIVFTLRNQEECIDLMNKTSA